MKIHIGYNFLIFEELPPMLDPSQFEKVKRGYKIEADKAALFAMLHIVSKDYDIELI